MHLFRYLQTLDRRFAWSFLGFVLGAVFAILTVYTDFIRDENPSLTFTTLSDASVLDVNEDISDLGITYRGKDISQCWPFTEGRCAKSGERR